MRSWTTRHQTGRYGLARTNHQLRQTCRTSPWDATEEDLQFMATLTERLGAPPVSNMMRYCGPEARHLDQLGESLGDWRRMLEALARHYPDLPRSSSQASDGTTLDSAPERIVWETLVQMVPDELELYCHPWLEEGRYLRSDFGLCAPDEETPLLCIEVMGMLGSDRICRADVEEASLDRLAAKQDWFSQPGRPLLRVIWLDMMAHPDWLEAICSEAIQAAVAQLAYGREGRRTSGRRLSARGAEQGRQLPLRGRTREYRVRKN
ncbi:hypothetical protein [Acetobacter cerevisiae]|uniref:hypothetical protein n=1 Tax=Acetobacter cerevisiae TaxID=178900 RepID=UPI0020A19C46|nr:hypothetical protein [Acetobacter cerevisiae]MCP1271762.1 hypothetical protein [Acetobacter cerevisiae]MCP1279718.1 hypothetical protein [Acetobacter cerevisiae]